MRATASDPYGPLPALTEVPDPSTSTSIFGHGDDTIFGRRQGFWPVVIRAFGSTATYMAQIKTFYKKHL
jgi:hypothetical protein